MGQAKLRKADRFFDLRKGLEIGQDVLITNPERIPYRIGKISVLLTAEQCRTSDDFIGISFGSAIGFYERKEFETLPLSKDYINGTIMDVFNAMPQGATFESLQSHMVARCVPVTEANTWLLNAGIRPVNTPAADWRLKGEKDPHEGCYDGPRNDLAGGQRTDDELAYMCGMADGRTPEDTIVFYYAKDRIRWLSRRLAKAEELLKANGLSL